MSAFKPIDFYQRNNVLLGLFILVFPPVLFLFLFGYTNIPIPVIRKGKKHHIACIGDSITYGCTVPFFFHNRYPAVLQRITGTDTQVAAFGSNDRTLQNTGNKPYRHEKVFTQSKDYCPDTVIILLGTNDSKDINWVSAESFRTQYAELINEYRVLESSPRIIICTPPAAFAPINRFFYVTNDAVFDRIPLIAEIIRSLAKSEGVDLVDLYDLTSGHREYFGPDGLHPSMIGAKMIAQAVRNVLDQGK